MTDAAADPVTRDAVLQHLSAFNGHDTQRLLGGVAENVVWSTGAEVYRGRASLLNLFDDWLWGLTPRLDLVRLIVDGDHAAALCVEHLVLDRNPVEIPIAVFFTVRAGLLTEVKVFREGSADIPTGDD